MKRDLLILAAGVLLVAVLVFCAFFLQPFMEARTYNKLTGSNVSTWDAMWVELRVQGEPK